jgi:hypothetical protein
VAPVGATGPGIFSSTHGEMYATSGTYTRTMGGPYAQNDSAFSQGSLSNVSFTGVAEKILSLKKTQQNSIKKRRNLNFILIFLYRRRGCILKSTATKTKTTKNTYRCFSSECRQREERHPKNFNLAIKFSIIPRILASR